MARHEYVQSGGRGGRPLTIQEKIQNLRKHEAEALKRQQDAEVQARKREREAKDEAAVSELFKKSLEGKLDQGPRLK